MAPLYSLFLYSNSVMGLRMRRLHFFVIVALTAGFLLGVPAGAQVSFDGAAIEEWADAYFDDALQKKQMTGASIGVVQNGETVFLKGYGWQDLGREIPLDPEVTKFRFCSTSKTYVATALMQLIERGQVRSLDAPANDYLKRFKLAPPYGDDVTIRHLLTLSSGMTGALSTPQAIARDIPAPVDSDELTRILSENLVRPPDELVLYSNLAVALEGALVEDVTGLSLADYMRREIFQPLGMTSATLHHSMTPPENTAVPYGVFPDGSLQETLFFPKHPATAASGGVMATTADVLKYLAFHADETGVTNPGVLSGDARRQMHTRQRANHPAEPGVALKFYHNRFGGQRMASHSCGSPGTNSFIAVFPDSQTGLSVSVLATDPTPAIGDLTALLWGGGRLQAGPDGPKEGLIDAVRAGNKFISEFVGAQDFRDASEIDIPDGLIPAHDALAGNYWAELRSKETISALLSTTATLKVDIADEDTLVIKGASYDRIGPGVYEKVGGDRRYFFTRAERTGEIFVGQRGIFPYRKVSGLGDPGLALPLFGLGLAVSLTGLGAFFWVGGGLRLIVKGSAIALGATVAALPIIAIAGYDTVLGMSLDYYNNDLFRMTIALLALNVHLALGLMLTAAAVWAWLSSAWGGGVRALATRAHLTVLALACAATWPGFWLFNLVGFNLR